MRLLLEASAAKTLIKAVHAPTGINDLLLAGIERVALAAYVKRNVLAQRRAGFDLIATAAAGGNVAVLRVNICFHANLRQQLGAKKSADNTRAPTDSNNEYSHYWALVHC